MPRKQPFAYEEFKSIYSRVPRLCVDLVVQTEEGVLLTLRQKDGWIGQWHLPGSTVYLHENIVDAIQRTAVEEIGVKVKVEKLLGYSEYHSELVQRGYGYAISLVFLCVLEGGEISIDETASKYEFFKKLPDNTIEEVKNFLTKHNLP